MIVEGAELRQATRLRCHTAVVGSGAGGAVVAKLLAEAGVDVVVLEEGGHHTARDFTQREDEMMPKLFRASGQQMSDDGIVNVLQGSTYGGSTVINLGDCVETPPEVFAHWRRLLGIDRIDERVLEPAVARVKQRLRVAKIPAGELNENNRLVLEGARKLGLAADSFEDNRSGCVGSGYCLIGCAYDAKQGCHITYLPDAVAAGARVHTDVRVERLERLADDRFTVHGAVVERGPRTPRLPIAVEARRVVLAAGAVHSPAILWRSGFDRGLPELGRNLTLQPQMGVWASYAQSRSVRAWRGVPQSTYCSAFDDNSAEHGLGGFRMEPIFGGIGQLGSALSGFGAGHKTMMTRAEHLALALLLVPDAPSGRITWEWDAARGFRPRIRYRPSAEWRARLRSGLARAAEIYFATGAEAVGTGSEVLPQLSSPDEIPRLADLPLHSGVTRLISAHVQGTCRMSLGPRRGVVDQDHRLHTLPNVYVVDASVMPTSASTHTMIPIMAMADRASRRMLETA